MHPKEPKSFINRVEAYLSKMPSDLHNISDDNQIRLIDTPRAWGLEMSQSGVSEAATKAVADLAGEIERMLANAEHTIDIVTLDAPKGLFLQAIHNGLKAHADRKTPLRVRFLFGFVPVEGSVEKFIKNLSAFRSKELTTDQVTIFAGQYFTTRYAWWNHAKIVAVDGRTAIVGGHNLWSDAYGGYPPVHDVSLQVTGPAAADAHRFAEFIWANADGWMDTWLVTPKGSKKQKIDPKVSVGKGTARWKVDQSHHKSEKEDEDSPQPSRQGWHRGRVMALGRAGGLKDSSLNASDIAKEVVIKNARKSLRICQQDLLFLSSKSLSKHNVCHWIVEALLANRDLEVQIVVSPIDGSGAGAQYSWGSGAIGTYRALAQLVQAKSKSKGQMSQALDRLAVAPFCFTGVRFRAEGRDYQWPNVPSNLHAFRFNPKSSLLTQSIWDKKPPAPGNHAKFYLADDQVYYIGSDNLYPHNLAEFGYLVEGDSVADVLENYWNRVWYYSGARCITEDTIREYVEYEKTMAKELLIAQRIAEGRKRVDELYPL